MTATIVARAHSVFGKRTDETLEDLIVQVVREALAHARFEAREMDEIVLGHFNAGFSRQDFTAGLVLQADPAFASRRRRVSRMRARPARQRCFRDCARSKLDRLGSNSLSAPKR